MITADLIQKIRKEIDKSPTAYVYFFNKLNDPKWLQPLSEAGYFKNPLPLIREGDYIQMPAWPESQYLVRIADKAQDEVLDIIKNNLKDANNERVMDDVVRMLFRMDASKAVNATDVVKSYLVNAHFLLGRSVPDLITKFADNNHVQPALSLASMMLEVSEDPNKAAELKKAYVILKPWTKYRDYEYEEILKKITPSLAKTAPIKVINLYAGLLQKAIDYEFTHLKGSDENENDLKLEEKSDDLSYIWRISISGDTQHSHSPKQSLTTALIDSVEILLRDETITSTDKLNTLKWLNDNEYYIFKRIVEYTLRDYKNEKVFKSLYKELESDERLQDIIKHPVVSHSGAVSYHPTKLLENLSNEDVIEKLKNYEPEDSFAFDRESLANELAELIKQDPSRFAGLLNEISTTRYEYLNESIQAFTEIIDDLREDVITDILKSLLTIHGNDARNEKKRFDYYSWSKSSTLRFIEKLSSQKEDKTERLTISNIKSAQKLVLLLCKDKNPSAEDERDSDPVELSINSIRGNAIHGLVYLLAWMNRNKVEKPLYKPIFDELDWHLIAGNDSAPAIRAVYGWRFELLYGTDKKWTTDNIQTIFSDDELGEAAFNAYARFSRVHPDELEVLGDVLNRQLPRLKTPPIDDGKSRHDALNNYVQRIALLYWHFSLDLSDNSLMRNLLDTADAKYIKELTNFIGFRLYKKESDTDMNELDKLVKLWAAVVDITRSDPSKVEALEEFGTWFASGKFDAKWSLEQLTYSASRAKQIHLDFAALERMETLAKDHPKESLAALSAMVDGAKERWAIDSWSSHAKVVIQSANDSSDTSIKESVKKLVDKLVAKGYLEYRDII